MGMIDTTGNHVWNYGMALTNHSDTPELDGNLKAGDFFTVSRLYTAAFYNPGSPRNHATHWGFGPSPTTAYQAYARGSGAVLGTGNVLWNSLGGTNPTYRVDVSFDISLLSLPDGYDGRINVYWASPTCANDVIVGSVPVSTEVIPEPGTLVMLGSGLVGIVGFGRRKKSTPRLRSGLQRAPRLRSGLQRAHSS